MSNPACKNVDIWTRLNFLVSVPAVVANRTGEHPQCRRRLRNADPKLHGRGHYSARAQDCPQEIEIN